MYMCYEFQLTEELKIVKQQIEDNTDENFTKFKDALDQFYTDKAKFEQRRDEIFTSGSEIQKLIGTLDNQMDASILATFEQLRSHFSDTFQNFAPNGAGILELILKQEEGPEVDTFSGVEARVSFSSTAPKDLVGRSQLADEQKAIVALTLILSVQKCSRAPFYLIDSIEKVSTLSYDISILFHRKSKFKTFLL